MSYTFAANIARRMPWRIFPIAALPVALQCQSNNRANCLERINIQKTILGYKVIDDYVHNDMIIGIGSGSTVQYAIQRLSEKLKNKELRNVYVVPCSHETIMNCKDHQVPIISLSQQPGIDLTISSVDEIDPNFNIIRGSCGSFCEKKLYELSREVIIICSENKLTRKLGPGVPLPIEVSIDDYKSLMKKVQDIPSLRGNRALLRRGTISNLYSDGTNITVTDDGNAIVDLYFDRPIVNPIAAERDLNLIPEVIAHGLYTGASKISKVMVATSHGVRSADKNDDDILPWWDEIAVRRPLERMRIDNTRPETNEED